MQQVCHSSEIAEGESRGFEINDLAFFIVNHQGHFYAYQNSCPHLGIELNWQENQFLDYDGQLIQCATHGALFLINNGRCVAGPCLDQHLKALQITLDKDVIYLI
jgi:nitrite reductase/ring-hydroxylating ferredoxin subunit